MSGAVRSHRRTVAARALALAAVVSLLAGSLAPSLASADGDPASDVLLSQLAFVPADAGLSTQQQASLTKLLEASAKAGFPVRVALVPEAYDLGYVTQLWAKPRTYADFLGVELSLVFKGPLLVVMPNGFGFNWPGHSTTSSYSLLSKVAIRSGGAGLLAATEAAVTRLADSAGASVDASVDSSTPATASTNASASGPPAILVVALAALAAALVIAFVVGRRHAARARADREALPAAPASSSAGGSGARPAALPGRLRLAIPGVALLFAVALGVPMLAFSGARGSSTPATPSGAEEHPSETPPITWPAGSRAAPNFTLSDQDGRPVSISAYRGRPVIVTFIDPLCRELCPLAAQVLSRAERQLPAAKRPEVIAVSVNVYGNARANLLQDFSKWHLSSQWRWAVGDPQRLASVWRRYYAEVDVTTKHIAGTTVHYLTHSEMAYVIDGNGYERALLSWPYSAKQVEQTVEQL